MQRSSSRTSCDSTRQQSVCLKTQISSLKACAMTTRNKQAKILLIILKSFDLQQYIHLPAKTVVAFAKTEEEGKIAYTEVAEIENLTESVKKHTEICYPKESQSETLLFHQTGIEEHRMVVMHQEEYSENAKDKLDSILQNFVNIISNSSGDIGTTPLISMDIDTGDSPPVSQRPYTLPLKHHEWVKSEIETLEDAGVIHKSFSPWASPIVMVPKKSEKGEPMKRRMCVGQHTSTRDNHNR